MMRLLLVLLLVVSFSSSATVPSLPIFMDSSNCVQLKCEWRGIGEQCKSATSFEKDGSGYPFTFLNENESDDDLLARLKGRHPLNTFRIVNNNNVGLREMCEGRYLWCNVARVILSREGYEDFFENQLESVPFALRTKLHC